MPPVAGIAPALELLIRSESGDAYALRHYASSEGGLRYRPRLVPPDQYEVNSIAAADGEPPVYVVRSVTSGAMVELSAAAYSVFRGIDGRASLLDLVTALFMATGALSPGDVRQTVTELQRAGLLVRRPQRHLRASPWRRAAATLRIPDANRAIGALYHRAAPLAFSTWSPWLAMAVATLGIFANAALPWGPTEAALRTHWEVGAATAAVMLGLILPGHELAHALTCRRFGRRVKAVGLRLLLGFLPVPYADVTEIWMASRRARARVYLAGPLSTLVLGSAMALAAWLTPQPLVRATAHASASAALALAGITLCPFLGYRSDGYYVLASQRGCPNLQRDALRLVTRVVLRRGSLKGFSPHERRLLAFAAATLGCLGTIAGWVVWECLTRLPHR